MMQRLPSHSIFIRGVFLLYPCIFRSLLVVPCSKHKSQSSILYRSFSQKAYLVFNTYKNVWILREE